MVAVEGPYVFPIEVLTHRLMHKFYVLDSTTPFVTGFDLLFAAHLIIDAVGRTVYTRSSSTNSYMSASLDPISPPATDVAVITSSKQGVRGATAGCREASDGSCASEADGGVDGSSVAGTGVGGDEGSSPGSDEVITATSVAGGEMGSNEADIYEFVEELLV